MLKDMSIKLNVYVNKKIMKISSKVFQNLTLVPAQIFLTIIN